MTHDLLWSRVVTSASVLAAWSKLYNSNSDARSVARITRWCCVCYNYPTRWLTFLLSVRLSVCNVYEVWSHSAINNYFQWSTTNFVKDKFWLGEFWLSIIASLAFSTPVFWCHDFHSRVFSRPFYTIRYTYSIFTCAQKLTSGQLNLTPGTETKNKEKLVYRLSILLVYSMSKIRSLEL